MTSPVPAVLIFFVLTGICASVREHVHAKRAGPLNADVDQFGATQLINKLEQGILTRNQGVSVSAYLENMFSDRRCKQRDDVQIASAFYIDGFVCAVEKFKITREEATEIMAMLGAPAANKQLFITAQAVKGAILGQGAPEERDQILETVWQKMTGGRDTLEADDLVCKKLATRGDFIKHIKAMGAANGGPLTKDVFKTYYHGLGESIKSHRLFVLMVVNAWHIMDGIYADVNTSNLRVRAVKEGEPNNGGHIFALKDDCGLKEGEENMNENQRIKKRLEEQEGTNFKFVSKSDRA